MARMQDWTRLVLTVATGLVCVVSSPVSAEAQHYSAWSAPQSLGALVNSTALDGCPAISRDGLSLYFATRRAGDQLDIYVSQRESQDDSWSEPQSVGPSVNAPASNEYCPALSRDGHFLFFASNRPGGCGGVDIYVSRRHNKRNDHGWGAPENLGCVVNSPDDEFGPNYFETEDGTPVLYFNSNRNGGFGGQDIYVATLSADGTFDLPSLVVELNTSSNDQQSAIARHGLEIIFTSTRPGGLGLADLWQATRASTGDPWSLPVNLGPAVNSSRGDARPALSWDGTELYFGSSREGGLGSDDLYISTRSKARGHRRDHDDRER